jgi:hypothetical protein
MSPFDTMSRKCNPYYLLYNDSRHVIVHIPGVLFSLHIILLNQLVDILLDIRHIQRPPILRLINNLSNKFCMTNRPSRFHDSNDGRLDLKLPISFHGFMSFSLFLRCLLELNLIYFQTVEWGCERCVYGESICCIDFFSFC